MSIRDGFQSWNRRPAPDVLTNVNQSGPIILQRLFFREFFHPLFSLFRWISSLMTFSTLFSIVCCKVISGTFEWTGYAFRTHCMFQLDIEKNNLTWMFTAPEPNADNSLNMILVFKKGSHVMITVKRIWETPASSSNVSPQYPDLCLCKRHVFQDFLRRPKFLSRNLVAIWRENLLEDDQLFHRLGLDLPLTVYDLDKWNSCAESKFCAVSPW